MLDKVLKSKIIIYRILEASWKIMKSYCRTMLIRRYDTIEKYYIRKGE